MGFLRKRGDYYVDEDPAPPPVLGIKPGGALYDIEAEAIEAQRQAEWQSRMDAKAAATRAMQEQDAEERREAHEAMERWLRERAAVELPEHLRGRGLGDA